MLVFPARFAFADAAPRGVDGPKLRALVATLRQDCGDDVVQVVGHTCPAGPPALNRRLALQRAHRVVALLEAAGVPRPRMEVVAAGADTGRAETVQGDEASRRKVTLTCRSTRSTPR
ncbi:MAG: OmpA family protein [Myxococcales bacterium]